MLSVPGSKHPHKVFIKVSKAEKIVPSQKDNKKKLNTKFRVTILGGKKKESSATVEDAGGNPIWDFSCHVKIHRGKADPLSLHVEDSEGHHKGQVVIPLVKIGPKPYTYSPDQSPATSGNIICAELEPTSKCSVPSGFLIYWIWVEEYFPEEDGQSRGSFNKSMTALFGSKSALGSSKLGLSVEASNIGSVGSLNKPAKHKNVLRGLGIKSKKDTSTKSSSDYKFYADGENNRGQLEFENSTNSKRNSMESIDVQSIYSGNPFNTSDDRRVKTKNYNPWTDQIELQSQGSHGSMSESGSNYRQGEITNDETDLLRRENEELKAQAILLSQNVTRLQSEVDHFKDTLFKLRSKLLAENAMRYLETV